MEGTFQAVVEELRGLPDGPLADDGADAKYAQALAKCRLPVDTLTAQQVRQAAMVARSAMSSAGEDIKTFLISASAFVLGVLSERHTMDRRLPES